MPVLIKPEDKWSCKSSSDLIIIHVIIIIIIIIITISIFKEDNVFSVIASLPYGPPVNTDIDYYRTFLFLKVLQC